VIEDDNLSYLHLAREDPQEISAYGLPFAESGHHDESGGYKESKKAAGSTVQNPAALSFRGHALQIADMIRAIREDGTPLVDGQAARRPVEIILGIYESARTHKEVTLP